MKWLEKDEKKTEKKERGGEKRGEENNMSILEVKLGVKMSR